MNYISIYIAFWTLISFNLDAGKRPFKLMFHLPSTQDVLQMQIEGYRCLTVFVSRSELELTMKDPYPPFEERGVLSFLFHDLQHMERFADPQFYCEQVC